ncbi:GAF domain-containing protein [Roseomonas sp. OT10]|uniref:GAF domain-containing protein n=1 Tax=Roseomonas cutis TaxID=2897332 RepID=UPI001E45335B|nr:GAF domain-containing protein [Roseomonas sp. OT10]UFN49780.1 GAF domain-containing protein [Roseomonas sp. OT10]
MKDRLLPELLTVTDAIARDGAPEAAFAAVDAAIGRLLDHGLFTILTVCEGGEEVERIYSSDPGSYPVQGRKRMGPTPWGDLVLTRKQTFLGPDVAAIRWAFPDHELIESLGLGSVINVTAQLGGEVLGTVNVLDREGAYTGEEQVSLVRAFTPHLIPALLAKRA